ncbi:MAG TPA: Ig-like domain-containing protein, partial [Armatimonadota bacterium]|nr:Ig-like domain-containing protein [Armatimonadota bacterium]
ETPPNFKIIRFTDPTHAIAGGEQGMLYGGELAGGQWTWTPALDENKDFVAHTISDFSISPTAPSKLWTCTGRYNYDLGGSIMVTEDGGANWRTLRHAPINSSYLHIPTPVGWLSQVSFYDDNHGWSVGRQDEPVAGGVILNTEDGGTSWTSIPPPAELSTELRAVAAVDATHVWVGGPGGLFIREGGSWAQVPAGVINRLSVRKEGSIYVGWAVGNGGAIWHTTDGVNWHTDDCPASSVNLLDISVYDSSHAAIAYGQGSFLKWRPDVSDPCGGHWVLDSSDPNYAKSSVAIDAAGNCLAVSGKTVRVGTNNGGTLSWSESYSIPDAHWRMRFLVCRLDGMGDLMDPTLGIPVDVRDMIDRSKASYETGGGHFVLNYGYGQDSTTAPANLNAVVGAENVVQAGGDVYLIHQADVMGYFSAGRVKHTGADPITSFGRPFNGWRPGAVGMYGDGFEGRSLRTPQFVWIPSPTRNGTQSPGILQVQIARCGHSEQDMSGYTPLKLRLYGPTGNLITETNFLADGTASIDLQANWPAGQGEVPYFQIYFPDGPPERRADDSICGFPGEYIPNGASTFWSAQMMASDRTDGVIYEICVEHSRCSELIREGASGTMGYANEPFGSDDDQMHRHYYVLPRYAGGFTWAEAAYLGGSDLGNQETVIGDPLMAPYATGQPSVWFTTPLEGETVASVFLVESEGTAVGNATEIARVEYWLSKLGPTGYEAHERIGTANEPPYSCLADISGLPDGTYTLHAVGYEDNPQGEAVEVTRQIAVANASSPLNVSLTLSPDGPHQSDSVLVEAVTTGSASVSRVDFWILDFSGQQLMASDASAPYTYSLDTTVRADGDYSIYAVAYWSYGPATGVSGDQRDIAIANPGIVSITSPAQDDTLASDMLQVDVAVNSAGPPSVGRVELWLSGPGVPERLEGTDFTYPYSITFNTTSVTNERYTLRAVAYKDGGQQIINDGTRTVIVSNDRPLYERISEARAQTDGTGLALEGKPVVAGTASTMDDAFYIEEADRSAGLRVAWLSSVQSGEMATILGTIGNNPTTGERELTAEQVWVGGDAPTVGPIFMTNLALGGESPTDEPYTNAVTGAYGLYNVGMLVTIVGKVVYVGDDYIYIDDGCGIHDGNAIERPIEVPLDGGPIPEYPEVGVPGVRVYLADLDKPGIDDYASITGISSLQHIGSNYAWYLRVRSQADITCPHGYTDADVFPTGIKDKQGNTLLLGTEVRLVDKCIFANLGDYFWGVDVQGPTACMFNVLAETTVTGDQVNCKPFTTIGTIADDISGLHSITPDAVYLGGSEEGAGGGTMGISSLGSTRLFSASSDTGSSSSEGPFEPWPGPTAEEVMASDWFNAIFYSPGSVGWALAQPDGTVVSLIGELVLSGDGTLYGIKETCDPIPEAPRLYLGLGYEPRKEIIRAQIDIVNGVITTLQDGKRAIVNPEAVYVYTDTKDRPCGPFWLKSAIPDASQWPSKRQVYP